MNQNIFRAYDVRGIYPSEINAKTVWTIARAFCDFISEKYKLKNPRVLVGRDNRTHGLELQKAFVLGLQENGAQVEVMEDSTSPLLYHAVCKGAYDAGCNVTASHNGPEYNGLKLVSRKAHSVAGDDIKQLYTLAQQYSNTQEKYSQLLWNESLIDTQKKAQDYFDEIKTLVKLQKPLKIVVDAGNGIAGKFYPELLRQVGCEVIELYCEQDGTFPHHQPDPIVESNTEDLKKEIKKHHADLGISFDGDGDRCAIVDELGNYHDANETLVILAKDTLKKHPGAQIVMTVSSSLIVPEEVEKSGGKTLMVPVGHSHVELAMAKHKALLGGEQSGHFFLQENYYSFDDAGYTAAKLCDILSSYKEVSHAYKSIRKTFSPPEFRITCADEEKFNYVAYFSKKLQERFSCITLDGVRADCGDRSWIGIRASNTSPKISVIVEAATLKKQEELIQLVKALLQEKNLKLLD